MVFRKIESLPLFLVAATALVAATQTQNQPSQQVSPDKTADAPKTPPNSKGGLQGTPSPVNPKTYLFGPEDVISIGVFHQPDLTRLVTVRADGKITMPLIGDMQAEGLTPERLRVQVTQALSTYINDLDVTVTVIQVNSKRSTKAPQIL
jgi:polysaccharide export outer membrane protein